MKRITLTVVSALFLASMLFAVNTAQGAAAKPIELKIAHAMPSTHVMHKDVLVPWTKMIEERSGGKVKFTIYPMEQLVKLRDMYDAVVAGTVDMGCGFPLGLPGKFELAAGIITLPFLFPDARVGSRVMWELHEINPAFRAQFNDTKVIWLHTTPPVVISTSKKPVRTLEDMKGLKIRVGGGSATNALKLLGAVPVTMATGDAYVALERGTIDGNCNAVEALVSYRLEEVVKYHTMVDFIAADFFGVMNKKKWESLPPDIQKIINEVSGAWAAEFIGKAWDKDQQNVIESLKKKGGHEFIMLSVQEQERWRKALQPVWDEVVKGMEARGVPGRKCLDDILKLRDKYSK